MIDINGVAIIAVTASESNDTIGSTVDERAVGGGKIKARMESHMMIERVKAMAKLATHLRILDRKAKRQVGDNLAHSFELVEGLEHIGGLFVNLRHMHRYVRSAFAIIARFFHNLLLDRIGIKAGLADD